MQILEKLPTRYDAGAATVVSGQTTVTPTNAAWFGNAWGDDLFFLPSQPMVPPQRIETVNEDGTLNLSLPWPGASAAGVDYEIRYVGMVERSTAQTRRYLEMLGQLSALGLQPNAFGIGADRDAYDDRPEGFIFLDIGDPWTLYVKQSSADADWSDGQPMEGAVGPPGPPGADSTVPGPAGADGADPGFLMTFSTATADADPGMGFIRANNASLAAATVLFIDKANRAGSNIASRLLELDDSSSAVKGKLWLTDPVTEAQASFVIGTVTDASGYVKVGVSNHNGATTFANSLAVSLQWQTTGDKGNDGSGTGDVSGPASSLIDNLVAFASATGKLIKDTGIAVSKLWTSDNLPITAFAKTILDDADAATARTTIGAEATQTAATQAEAEAGTGNAIRSWTPQRIFQAIASWIKSWIGSNQLGDIRNLVINPLGTVNQRGYVSGTATTAAKQFTLDRWYVVTSGQNLSWTEAAGVRTMTAPAGGVEQAIEASMIIPGTYVLNWEGTATATLGGVARAKGEPFTLDGTSNLALRFIGGTFSKPQLERSATVSNFSYRAFLQEIALCQWFYFVGSNAQGSGTQYANAAVSAADGGCIQIPFMRVKPSASFVSLPTYQNCSNAQINTGLQTMQSGASIRVNVTAAGNYRAYDAIVAFDAELTL